MMAIYGGWVAQLKNDGRDARNLAELHTFFRHITDIVPLLALTELGRGLLFHSGGQPTWLL